VLTPQISAWAVIEAAVLALAVLAMQAAIPAAIFCWLTRPLRRVRVFTWQRALVPVALAALAGLDYVLAPLLYLTPRLGLNGAVAHLAQPVGAGAFQINLTNAWLWAQRPEPAFALIQAPFALGGLALVRWAALSGWPWRRAQAGAAAGQDAAGTGPRYFGGNFRAVPLLVNRQEMAAWRWLKGRAWRLGAATICPKVRLEDIIAAMDRDPAARGRIKSRHVDFLLVGGDWKPLMVVEVDGGSHDAPERRERDAFIDGALGDCGIPVLHLMTGGPWGAWDQALNELLARLQHERHDEGGTAEEEYAAAFGGDSTRGQEPDDGAGGPIIDLPPSSYRVKS
jgi:hypothetical protein